MGAFFQLIIRIYRKLYEAYAHWCKDDAVVLAAATSYYMALSFFPLLLLLLSVMGFLLKFTGWGINAQQRLLTLLADNVAPSLAAQVEVALSSVKTNAALSGPVGLITLLMAAMAVFAQFERAFDRIWNVPGREYTGILAAIRHILFQRLRAFLLLLGVWLLVIAAFLFNMTLATMQTFASTHLMQSHTVWSLVTAGSSVAMNCLLFTIMYKILPKTPVRWKAAAGGGLLAAVIWEAGRRILAALVIGTHYSVYGVVGAFIAVMLWFYYATATVFFAAEFARVIDKKSRAGQAPRA
ncbi:MAG: YihY/virulence factor BrkB family protein [Thermoguttaceae bacterium]|jgi:membrane protein